VPSRARLPNPATVLRGTERLPFGYDGVIRSRSRLGPRWRAAQRSSCPPPRRRRGR
jgi:hypothetical protein